MLRLKPEGESNLLKWRSFEKHPHRGVSKFFLLSSEICELSWAQLYIHAFAMLVGVIALRAFSHISELKIYIPVSYG